MQNGKKSVRARITEAKKEHGRGQKYRVRPSTHLYHSGNGNVFINRIGLDEPSLGTIPLALAPAPCRRRRLTLARHVDVDVEADTSSTRAPWHMSSHICIRVFKPKPKSKMAFLRVVFFFILLMLMLLRATVIVTGITPKQQ
jgi:hypothetical protein